MWTSVLEDITSPVRTCQWLGQWAGRETTRDLQHISPARGASVVRKNLEQGPARPLGSFWLSSPSSLLSCSSAYSGLELWVNHRNQRWKEMHEVISSCPCQCRIIPHSTVLSAFSSLFLNDSEERAFLSSLGRLALLFSRPHCWGIFFLFSSSPLP